MWAPLRGPPLHFTGSEFGITFKSPRCCWACSAASCVRTGLQGRRESGFGGHPLCLTNTCYSPLPMPWPARRAWRGGHLSRPCSSSLGSPALLISGRPPQKGSQIPGEWGWESGSGGRGEVRHWETGSSRPCDVGVQRLL